jgi:hypothetical protein
MSGDKVTERKLLIGWASRDITPERPVLLRGQFHARVSEGVMDPITITALALESVGDADADAGSGGQAVMVSCDLVGIPDSLRDAVRERLRKSLPELQAEHVCLNATHTHEAPELRTEDTTTLQPLGSTPACKVLSAEELGAMASAEYACFAAERIAEAVTEAWNSRKPGGIGFGLGQAVVGHNRRISYFGGETRMYGKTDDPDFSHPEGAEDHSVNLLCTYDQESKLTGLVVNLACPSQASELAFKVSADYWHQTRGELRRRLGEDLFVLPQCSAAGDQSPHFQLGKAAEKRMRKLAGRTRRQEIAARIADAVTTSLPLIAKDINWNPVCGFRAETLELPLRKLSREDVAGANAEGARWQSKYEALLSEVTEHPEKTKIPRWYVEITEAHSRMLWNQGVERRFEMQQEQPNLTVEVHVLRLGSAVFATNSFELYLDFGLQIKAGSPALQTFVVQLTGSGTYLPTARATAGKSYGAIPASTPVGPEGGRRLVKRSVEIITELMQG